MEVLNVSHLSKAYPGFRLEDVSFSVRTGTIMGFIGRNGAGKSTTLKSIMNMVHADAGQVTFFGLDMTKNERTVKQRIGYAGGAVDYYKKKKIRTLLEITGVFYDHWDEAVCRKYLQLFSLDENKTPSELSEGMKVKLSLVIALSHGARLLILDEPFVGLDPKAAVILKGIMAEICREGGAIFFSTHVLDVAEKLCNKVAIVKDGRLIASGDMDAIVRPGQSLESIFMEVVDDAEAN